MELELSRILTKQRSTVSVTLPILINGPRRSLGDICEISLRKKLFKKREPLVARDEV